MRRKPQSASRFLSAVRLERTFEAAPAIEDTIDHYALRFDVKCYRHATFKAYNTKSGRQIVTSMAALWEYAERLQNASMRSI